MNHSLSPIQRIALLSVHTSPLAPLGQKKTGGMNVYVRDFAQELTRRDIQVDVFTRAVSPSVPYIQYDLACGCRVINLAAGPLKTIPNDDIATYLDEFTAGVDQFARDYHLQYDLIHSHYWLSGVVAGKLRQFWGPLPVVHMYHTLGHLKNQIARDITEYAAPVRIFGETHVANLADTIIAATPAEEAQLIKYYNVNPEKITIIPPGVDLGRFEPTRQCVAKRRLGIPKTQKTILSVGRIEPLKGIDTLLQAVAQLQRDHRQILDNVQVVVIGGTPDEPDQEMARLLHMRTELGLEKLVDFVGARDQSALPDYYAAADMVVMPSHYESFGMVALEAMAMSTPVVASNIGGLAHLVLDGETGFLVHPFSHQAFANRIHRLLTDDDLRKQLSVQAHAYAKGYRWSNIVDQMLDSYALLRESVAIV
jgi:D-inositol-3-phosphate glycosyltransferase